ncbi:neurexin-4 isoform X1 [Drosophila sulfurigaster albostrigata]|uniref:neurexin-4 isoform X1 n=1 Tax=Drosophila sulfurigaster albostrigata TaxID=89887 RepID=UPI002D219BC2|nr:neurexin-4 isoform X1 [Drosophila sulfurigaster albostrigata]
MRQAIKATTLTISSICCCLLLLGSNNVGVARADSFSDYFSDYECNQPLMERAVLTATSSLTERGPDKARLNAGTSWSAKHSDFDQRLIIDLGLVRNVTHIALQGRPHSNEYVTEYTISYGITDLEFADYKEPGGNVKMFKGNSDGNNIHYNIFEVPIIAQWVRINPTRWHDRISMRVELYGCEYIAENLYFNGTGLVRYELKEHAIASLRESIRFRFKTAFANGIMMYSRGSQGDYYALQLKDNKMVMNVKLGTNSMASLSVGSLLDDNVWHDVVVSRNKQDIIFSVDRVIVRSRISGDYTRLNLNQQLYLGGVPNVQEGLIVQQNFSGCLENIYFNSTNFIRVMKDSYELNEAHLYTKVNSLFACPSPSNYPVTFTTRGSFVKLKGYENSQRLNVSFYFRTYEETGVMVQHEFYSGGYVKVFLEFGKVKIDLSMKDRPRIILDNYEDQFNDGKWHSFVLSIERNRLIINIDQRPMTTTKNIQIATGSLYYIAGGLDRNGFVGCMRLISVDGNYKLPQDWVQGEEVCCGDEVVVDACQMIDRCNPNPCQHKGVCHQNSMEFFCDCAHTGYAGAVCHTSNNPLSCQALKNVQHVQQRVNLNIDVDGSGPLEPFPVTCEFYSDGRVITTLSHSQEHTTTVDGFQEPGSFAQSIMYDANQLQIEALLNRSHSCWQRLSYSCHSSRLFNSPSEAGNFRPFAWWISRNNQPMDYWAGALPGSRKCECGILGKCNDPTKWCNCDSNSLEWTEDGGDIREKEHLPVRAVKFGDTGTPLDEKYGRYTLGPMRCEGDDLFSNVVTFRIADASINLPPFDMGHSGDIYLEFRTTQENAVIFHATGPTDYIKLSLNGGNKLQFQYQAGSGPLGVNVGTSYHLNDNNWHTVSVERNRKEARLVVDGSIKAEVREPPGPVRALHLTSDLVIGATTEYRDGYVGCIRALLLNGKMVDLKDYSKRGLYGISTGCVGRCESSPCLNNGTCIERYDGYSCDCRWSAFKGPICADEIGVNLRSASIIRYEFEGSFRSTIAENIRVGFTTTIPKGFLLGFTSNLTGEYLTIQISNSGHLRCVFDFGFERQEIIFPKKHFGLGQYHDVRFMRKNSGSTVVLQVDNYEPVEYHFDIKASADAQFNNIQYMYIGKNLSMTDGFVGCVSRVQFDDIYPLKLMFQQNPPNNVKSLGTNLTEDFCGVEPVTHPPIEIETRPPPLVDEEKLRKAYNEVNSVLLAFLLAILFLLLCLMFFLIGRYLHRHKGDYLTHEDNGADGADDPDDAVLHSTTGHQVRKRTEIFI